MPFYEVIYETGAFSVAEYGDDTEALEAVKAHHGRAAAGEPGGPTGHPAERIVKVLKYDVHPADLTLSQMMDAKEVYAEIKGIIEEVSVGGQVSVPELTAAVRDLTAPMIESPPHESNFKAHSKGELNATDWQAA